jgi:hypothetical protein
MEQLEKSSKVTGAAPTIANLRFRCVKRVYKAAAAKKPENKTKHSLRLVDIRAIIAQIMRTKLRLR